MRLYTINGCKCYLKETTAKKILAEVKQVAWEQEMTEALREARKIGLATGDWSDHLWLWDVLIGDPLYD